MTQKMILCVPLFLSLLGASSWDPQWESNAPVRSSGVDETGLAKSELNEQDLRYLKKNMRTRLPAYLEAFQKAAEDHNIPWKLLAAVAYQESHWDHSATSFTGVKGIMQITADTARHLGLEDSEDAIASIYAGAKYLKQLYSLSPSDLGETEKWSLALAAYNSGPGHLKSAQALAEDLGVDPWKWESLRMAYGELSNPEVSSRFPYGPARGYETIRHVERSLAFYAALEKKLTRD